MLLIYRLRTDGNVSFAVSPKGWTADLLHGHARINMYANCERVSASTNSASQTLTVTGFCFNFSIFCCSFKFIGPFFCRLSVELIVDFLMINYLCSDWYTLVLGSLFFLYCIMFAVYDLYNECIDILCLLFVYDRYYVFIDIRLTKYSKYLVFACFQARYHRKLNTAFITGYRLGYSYLSYMCPGHNIELQHRVKLYWIECVDSGLVLAKVLT